jgi:DNA (cytosine-5)-methyltransferase 1
MSLRTPAAHVGSRPVLVDLFCKAGGATKGYQLAGFYVIGVDIEPQPNYCGDEFVQADALEYPLDRADAIHASPPCQDDLRGLKAVNRKLGREYTHANLTAAIRARVRTTGKPYAIEQPEQGARLINPVRLCGSSFGLPIRRHRQFESNVLLLGPSCDHSWQTERKYWTGWRPNGEHRLATVVQVYGNGANRHEWPAALGIDWMTADELTQAIPPAYTEHIGRQLMAYLQSAEAA